MPCFHSSRWSRNPEGRVPWRLISPVGLIGGTLGLLFAATVFAPTTLALAKPSGLAHQAPVLSDYEVGRLRLGGDFTLTDQLGKRVNLSQFRHKVVALSFGYTFCPDVCPATLAKVDRVRHALGSQGSRLQPMFVTIDPERDTPARLKAYLSNFAPGIVGLTGTSDQVAKAAHLYRARYEKEPGRGPTEYLMAHTAYLYLVDGRGDLRYLFPSDAADALVIQGIEKVLGNG